MKKRYLEVMLLLVVIAVFGRFAFWNGQEATSPSPSHTHSNANDCQSFSPGDAGYR